jgi:ABC-type dipeptide/oligopeptide/nickel transport system ATPase subunit
MNLKKVLYAIMGGSGSGKTTLISIIAALDKPTNGKIYYDGTDISKISGDEYRANKVSIIFQLICYNYTAILRTTNDHPYNNHWEQVHNLWSIKKKISQTA